MTVQMALARGAKVIASASEANQDYLQEIGATRVLSGQGMAERVGPLPAGRSTQSLTSPARPRSRT